MNLLAVAGEDLASDVSANPLATLVVWIRLPFLPGFDRPSRMAAAMRSAA